MTTQPQGAAQPARAALPFSLSFLFSFPQLPLGALSLALSVYLPRYYATHLGVGLAAVGAAFTIVRLIDIVFDPMIGLVMDKTRTQWGRYRVWLIAGGPILAIAAYMLFMAEEADQLYLTFWLLVIYAGTSIIALAHSSWAAVIAPKYDDRSRLFAIIQAIGVIGATAVLLTPVVITWLTGGGTSVTSMGWLIVIVTPITVLLAILRTPEPMERPPAHEQFRLRDYWEMVTQPAMARIIIADFCLAMGPGWMAALYVFFFVDFLQFSEANANILLLIYIFAGIVGSIALGRLAQMYGKHRSLIGASTLYSAGLVLLPFLPRGEFIPTAILMFTLGAAAAGFSLLTRAMVADVGDLIRLQQNKQRVGLLYAMITSTQKIAGALSIGVTFSVLALVGYRAEEGVENTQAAIDGLFWVYLLGPIIFVGLGGACFLGYSLDEKRHAEIRRDLEERDALVEEAPIIESLTGSQMLPDRPSSAPQ